MWALVLSVVGFVYAGRREWVAIYTPMVLLWATLMIAAPTVTPFRYMEPIIMVVSIGLGRPAGHRPRHLGTGAPTP